MNNTAAYIAALDVGGRRIGVALAHREAALPTPHSTLINDDQLWTNLQQLLEREQVGELVIGLPRGLDGQETAQTQTVRDFVEELKLHINLPIHWQDEAGTSVQAEAELQASGKRYNALRTGRYTHKGYNKDMVDAQAAAIILQDYLQTRKELT